MEPKEIIIRLTLAVIYFSFAILISFGCIFIFRLWRKEKIVEDLIGLSLFAIILVLLIREGVGLLLPFVI